MNNTIFFPLIILAIIANVLWYEVKSILSDNGYKVSYWYGHLKDLPNFRNLISKTENPVKKARYVKTFWALIIATVLFILMGALMIMNE